MISPGLNGEDETVSFQSVDDRSKYICVVNNALKLCDQDEFDDIATFNNASTFYLRENQNGSVAFESCALPNNFIKFDNGTFVLDEEDDGNDESTPEFTSFNIITAEEIPGTKTILSEILETVIWLISPNVSICEKFEMFSHYLKLLNE